MDGRIGRSAAMPSRPGAADDRGAATFAVEKFATLSIPPAERLRYWNALVDRTYSGTFVNAPALTSRPRCGAGRSATWR